METKQQEKSKFVGKYRFKKFDSVTGKQTWEGPWIENLVVASTNHGLGIIMQHLIGETTYPLEITQGKIGTGTTAPTSGDTDLETVTLAGILRATQDITATSCTIEFYISNTDLANGTYNEFGLFCGTQLFSRSIISPAFTKSTNEDTGIEYLITASNT